MTAHKVCTACKKNKPVGEFYRTGDRTEAKCKVCSLHARGRTPSGEAKESAGPAQNAREKFTREETDDTVVIESPASESVRTVQDALDKADVDLAIWEVERFVCNSWEVGMKQEDGSAKVTPLWQVKVWLRRKVPKLIENAADALYARMQKHSPKFPKIIRPAGRGAPHMMEVALFDAHFGKLCWAPETGSDYDLKIAEAVFENAVTDLIDRAAHLNIEKFVFPIGQDFFNINNKAGTTAKGTPQDGDSRYYKVFDVGVAAVIRAIEYCLRRGPVEVPWVPGNHDPEMSWHMAKMVECHFRLCKDVTVDARPTKRKLIRYGANGIMLTHAEDENHRDLPITMASEDRKMWGDIEYAEVHCGHYHKKKQTYFCGADTFGGGTVVRVLPSLSGHDAFHASHGWNKTARAAEGLLWGRTPGLAGYFNVMARA